MPHAVISRELTLLSPNQKYLLTTLASLILVAGGCRAVPTFPDRPIRVQQLPDGSKQMVFDTDGDRKADYLQALSTSGRKVELRFTAKADLPERVIMLDQLDPNAVPHFIIALDGVPYDLVEELYLQGYFRLFYRPSQLISTFPSMDCIRFWRTLWIGTRTGK